MQKLPLVVLLALAALVAASTGAQNSAKPLNQTDSSPSSDKLKELRADRIATLKMLVDIQSRLHQSAQASSESLAEARVLLCAAQLDAADKKSDRIAALKSLVAILHEYEEVAKVRKQAAKGTEADILQIKARRLEAEIRLEQEQEQEQEQTQAANVKPENERVVVSGLRTKDVVVAERFTCQIHSQRRVDIRPLQRGQLEEIAVKEGQAVKQGDVMFRTTPVLYRAKLDAELEQVRLAQINLNNSEKLFQNKVISADEVALLKARLASAQAKAKLAQAELSQAIISAPFDGIVGRLQEQQGSVVAERETLATLYDNNVMWIDFPVSQAYYLAYMSDPAKYQEVEAELVLADGRKFPQPGKLMAIEAQFDRNTGTIPVRAEFPNPDGILRHGMTGNLLLRRKLADSIVVPQRAALEILGKRYVYVVGKDDIVQRREIVVQHELTDDFVIQQGLAVGDRIVIDGISQIKVGEKLEYELRKP